jgi:hypothetical protein
MEVENRFTRTSTENINPGSTTEKQNGKKNNISINMEHSDIVMWLGLSIITSEEFGLLICKKLQY